MRGGLKVNLYVEGGGDSDATRTELRQAFSTLLESAGVRNSPRIIACGGRSTTLEDFRSAVESRAGAERALLLVDSESEVVEGDSVWVHLEKEDGWKAPEGTDESTAYLMIQCMETWLIADREALTAYCGSGFNNKKIPRWPGLEAVAKSAVQQALREAMRAGKAYAKGQVSFEILARVTPASLEAACPEAKRFLDAMRAL